MSDLSQMVTDVATHLEFVGYDCEIKADEVIFARHSSKMNIAVLIFDNAIVIDGSYNTKPVAKSNPLGFLQAINAVNKEMLVSRVFADDDLDFRVKATMIVAYSRKPFNEFLRAFDNDNATFVKNKELVAFLS